MLFDIGWKGWRKSELAAMTPKGANCEEGSRDFEEGVGQLQGEARRFNLSEENVGGGRTMRVI